MTEQNMPPAPQIAEDEKLTPAMFYTSHNLIWGQVYSKQAIRVSTWLRTEMAPAYIKILNAQVLTVGGAQALAPVKSTEMYLQVGNINAYHVLPPAEEGVDYQPDEPNRKMVPTKAFVGHFQFDGFTRMADFTTVDNYLAAAKGEFISIYDFTMRCPAVPSIKGISAPMVLLRQKRVAFAVETS